MLLKNAPFAARGLALLAFTGASVVLFAIDEPGTWTDHRIFKIVRGAMVLFALFFALHRIVELKIQTKIGLAMLLGVLAGWLGREQVADLKLVGDGFIRLIRMTVVPLVLASITVGVASLNDLRKLGRIGGKTVAYYLATTAIAITIGLGIANLVKPGVGLETETTSEILAENAAAASEKTGKALSDTPSPGESVLNLIPINPVESLSGAEMLQIIFFAIFLGIGLTLLLDEKSRPVIAFFDGLSEAMIKIIQLVMAVAPFGVFALIAAIVGNFGPEILLTLMKYALCVVVGLAVHMIFTYGLAVRIFTNVRPLHFFRSIRPAQLIAFSSSSSAATLPVTIQCCEERIGVHKDVASFVLPLGATMNMDGTALYQGVAAVFIAQVYNMGLDLSAQLTIVLTATLASIGTAAVPGVGMILLTMVLQSVNVPLEGIALILGVDRILDMCRTTVNVTGDASCCTVVAASEDEISDPLAVVETSSN